MKKHVVRLLIAALMVNTLAFTGCGAADEKSGKDEKEVEEESSSDDEEDEDGAKTVVSTDNAYGSWFPFDTVIADEGNEGVWQEVSSELDANEIISNTELTPEFLYGEYYFYDDTDCKGGYEPVDAFLEKSEWVDLASYIGDVNYDSLYEGHVITTMPYGVQAGPESYFSEVNGIPGYYWCGLLFAEKDPDGPYGAKRYEVPAAYTIEGDKVIFHLMTKYEYDHEANSIDYQFGDKTIEYTFERTPLTLSLSNGKQTVNMLAFDFMTGDNGGLFLKAELEEGQVSELPFDGFSLSCEKDLSRSLCVVDFPEGSVYDCAWKITEDGLLTICTKSDDATTTYQYVMYVCGEDGMILCDKDGAHRFTKASRWTNETYGTMNVNNIRPEDMEKLGKLSAEDLQKINETRENLMADIEKILDQIGVGITLNEETGDVVLDASVLFETNSAEVSEEGRKQLAMFALAFSEILQRDEYKDFIGEFNISGHTDSDGDYEYNKKLSLRRAEAVRDCLLEALEENPEIQEKVASMITVEGCSYDQLIYDDNGDEDKAASRRVVFAFYINLDSFE